MLNVQKNIIQIKNSYGDPDSEKNGQGLAMHLAYEFYTDYFKDDSWSISTETIREYINNSPYLELNT